jgi:hypothetical protein
MIFFKNRRARKRFNVCHNSFITKINRLGFMYESTNYYICGRYNIVADNNYDDKYNYISSRLILYIDETYIHQTIFIVQDFYENEKDKHEDMLDYIMSMGVFSRKLKIEKILKNIR